MKLQQNFYHTWKNGRWLLPLCECMVLCSSVFCKFFPTCHTMVALLLLLGSFNGGVFQSFLQMLCLMHSLKRLFLAGNFPITLAPRPMLTKYLAKPIAQKFSRTSCNLMHILNFNLLNVPTPCPRLTKMLPLFFALLEFFSFLACYILYNDVLKRNRCQG